MTNYDVYCYGEIGIDNIIELPHLPSPELAAFPTGDSYHVGGAAANTAVWLASFGFSVGLTGNAIGFDSYGQQLWQSLKQHPNIDLSLIQRNKGVNTPFCRAMVTPDGERSFLIYGYPQAPKVGLQANMLRGASYLALDLYGGDERLAAARTAHKADVKIVISDVIQPDHPVLPLTHIVINSGSYIRATFPGIDIRQYAHQLQAINQGILITTDGANEVYVVAEDGSSFSVQPPQVTAKDATGAGDAFRSGLLAGLLSNHELAHAVRWGVAAGATKVQHLGAATYVPPLAEVQEMAGTLAKKLVQSTFNCIGGNS
ncbi:MAG: carbohydrate kinase family protein [Chloroflexi bacterium]|nr:carbohydrate kinase family protein [Chloroflexota bacterium]